MIKFPLMFFGFTLLFLFFSSGVNASEEEYITDAHEIQILIETLPTEAFIPPDESYEKYQAFVEDGLMDRGVYPERRRQILLNKIDIVINIIMTHNYNAAANKLEKDVLAKMDGEFGGQPNNDWVFGFDDQMIIYPPVYILVLKLRNQYPGNPSPPYYSLKCILTINGFDITQLKFRAATRLSWPVSDHPDFSAYKLYRTDVKPGWAVPTVGWIAIITMIAIFSVVMIVFRRTRRYGFSSFFVVIALLCLGSGNTRNDWGNPIATLNTRINPDQTYDPDHPMLYNDETYEYEDEILSGSMINERKQYWYKLEVVNSSNTVLTISDLALVTFKPDPSEKPTITYVLPPDYNHFQRKNFELELTITAPGNDINLGSFEVEIRRDDPAYLYCLNDPDHDDYNTSVCKAYELIYQDFQMTRSYDHESGMYFYRFIYPNPNNPSPTRVPKFFVGNNVLRAGITSVSQELEKGGNDRHIYVEITPIDTSKLLTYPSEGGMIRVVGYPGCVDPEINVILENITTGASLSAFQADTSGSFFAELSGLDGIPNEIQISVSTDDGSQTNTKNVSTAAEKGDLISTWTGSGNGEWTFELAMGVLQAILGPACPDPCMGYIGHDIYSFSFNEYEMADGSALIQGEGRITATSLSTGFDPAFYCGAATCSLGALPTPPEGYFSYPISGRRVGDTYDILQELPTTVALGCASVEGFISTDDTHVFNMVAPVRRVYTQARYEPEQGSCGKLILEKDMNLTFGMVDWIDFLGGIYRHGVRVTYRCLGKAEPQWNGETPVAIEITDVAFNHGGQNDGHNLRNHSDNSNISTPEWKSSNSASQNQPGAFTKNTSFVIKAGFKAPLNIKSALIWAAGEFGGLSVDTPVKVTFTNGVSDWNNNEFVIKTPPNSIKYNKKGINEVIWSWHAKEITDDTGNVSASTCEIGETSHEFCITAKDPTFQPIYKWVMLNSCMLADGQTSNDEKAIVDDLYDNLEDVRSDSWDSNGILLYWTAGSANSTQALLVAHNAKCRGWGEFFFDLGMAQGINPTNLTKNQFIIKDTAGSCSTETMWFSIICTSPGINRTSCAFLPESPYWVVSTSYPYPKWFENNTAASDDITYYALERWYRFDASPIPDGHSLVFLRSGGNAYLYDPSFHTTTTPFINPYGVGIVPSGDKIGSANNEFRNKYFNSSVGIQYVRGQAFYKPGTDSSGVYLTTLTDDLGISNVVIPVASTSSFEDVGYILIGQERIRYNFKMSSVFGDATHPCERGYCVTTPSGHSSGADVYPLKTDITFNRLKGLDIKPDLLPETHLNLFWQPY